MIFIINNSFILDNNPVVIYEKGLEYKVYLYSVNQYIIKRVFGLKS